MCIDAYPIQLGEVLEIRAGFPFRGAIEEVPDGGTLVVQMKDVDPLAGVEWMSATRAQLRGRKVPSWLRAGDLLLAARGDRFYSVPVSPPPEPAVCGPHLLHLRLKAPDQALPAFVAWQLNQPPAQRRLHAAAEGSSQLSVRVGELAKLVLALPPLHQQAQVLALADAAARERQMLTRMLTLREVQLAALAQDIDQTAGLSGR